MGVGCWDELKWGVVNTNKPMGLMIWRRV